MRGLKRVFCPPPPRPRGRSFWVQRDPAWKGPCFLRRCSGSATPESHSLHVLQNSSQKSTLILYIFLRCRCVFLANSTVVYINGASLSLPRLACSAAVKPTWKHGPRPEAAVTRPHPPMDVSQCAHRGAREATGCPVLLMRPTRLAWASLATSSWKVY